MDKRLAKLVRRRADNRCEYCLIPLPPFHVEHIIARKHGGPTAEGNLALSCMWCNLHKGPNLSGIDPETGVVVALYHPRRDRWAEHFGWDGTRLFGVTPTGRATIEVLNINDPLRIQARERFVIEGRMRLG